MSNVLVLGGTGFVGRSVCARLAARAVGTSGCVRVPSRRPSRAPHLRLLPKVEVVGADVHDDAALARVVAGCGAVVNLVAILHGGGADFERVHVRLAERLARACSGAGVRRVVHVSALGAERDAPSRYLRSKAAGEAALKAAGLDLTILRPSVIFGAHDRFLNLFAGLSAWFPALPLAGADARFQPVWVDDVAAAVVACLDDRSTVGETIECCGPTVHTLRELVRLAGRWSGHERPVIGLPEPLGKLQAALMELLPGTPLMSRDNVDSMRVANVCGGVLPGLARLGIRPTPLESVAPAYLGRGRAA